MTLTNADLADPEAHAASIATTDAFLLGSTDGPAPDAAGVDDDDVTIRMWNFVSAIRGALALGCHRLELCFCYSRMEVFQLAHALRLPRVLRQGRFFLLRPQERQGDGEHRLVLRRAGLLQYGLVQSKPSMVAAAAVYVARLTLKMTPLWIDTLRHHTGFTEAQLMDAAKILIGGHGMKPRFFGQETRQRSCRWHGR
ncbi:Cyclin-B1-1 [Hordeum vulgare]|nr:Cyclin-B1-1 [Hordeum vulgare]